MYRGGASGQSKDHFYYFAIINSLTSANDLILSRGSFLRYFFNIQGLEIVPDPGL